MIVAASLSVVAGAAVAYVSVDERKLGRTNPSLAAFYSPPWGNFVETYTDGAAVGFTVGMQREIALHAAPREGFTVDPASWGDHRAGGASLYSETELYRQAMLPDTLHFTTDREDVEGLTLSFHQESIRSITVVYINNGL